MGQVDTNPEEALEALQVTLLATLISNNGNLLIIVVIQRRLAILKPKRR